MKPILTTACLLALAACSGSDVKETLGLDRNAPDEFRVVSRPPLSVPPQFNLRPPSAMTASPATLPAHKQAESVVLGGGNALPLDATTQAPAKTKAQNNNAEAAFLNRAGTAQADPSVRDHLLEERIEKQEKPHAWWDVFSSANEKPEPVVSPKGEAGRIKENQDEGRPVTEGATPESGSSDKGWFRRLLGI